MSSEFRRSRQKLSQPIPDYHLNKQNIFLHTNINSSYLPNDLLDVRKNHHQQIKSKQQQCQKRIKELELKHSNTVQSMQESFENRIKQKMDYIDLLEESIKNMESNHQQEIDNLKKKLEQIEKTQRIQDEKRDKERQKQYEKDLKHKDPSSNCVTSCSARESFVTPHLTQRMSISRQTSKSILRNVNSIESKHKVIPARKPVYTKESFFQRKGLNLLKLDLD